MVRILLVEDDEFNRAVIEDTVSLDDIPAEIIFAESGEEAIERAMELVPDLILMDVRLPGMDGLETTRRLKQEPATRNIPIWAVTANAMKGDDELAFQAGCSKYISKPINVKGFGDILRGFVSNLNNNIEGDHA